MFHLMTKFWIFCLSITGMNAIQSYGFVKVPIVSVITSAQVMATKGRSLLECSVLCAQHTSCVQAKFNKTSQTCFGFSTKQASSGSATSSSSYEISCKTPGYSRRTDSSLCIRIILDPSITTWNDVFNQCQFDGPNIFPLDVSEQHEFLHFQNYLLNEYVPYIGTPFQGTAVGLTRFTATSPWKSLITGETFDSSHWSQLIDNNGASCLAYWMYPGPSIILDDLSCNTLLPLGSIQPIICQEK